MVIKDTIDDSLILLHNAAQFFGIGYITAVEPRPEGLANLTFLVKTDQGEYILKEVLNRTIAETELEMLYLKRVLAHNIPAPEYLLGLDGRTIFCQENHHVVAQKKVDGQAPEITVEVCQTLGQQLGKLHQIPTEGLPPKRDWMASDYVPTRLAALRGQPFKYVTEAIEAYERLKDVDPDGLPQVLIHGDITEDNLLFEGDELRAIIDWQQAGVGAAIMDLAGAIVGLGLLQRGGQINSRLYRALLTGYQRERLLQKVEVDHLCKVVQYMGLTVSVWALYKYGIQTPDEERVEWGEWYWHYNLDTLELPKL